jgi:hypothetical protein
MKSLPRRLFDFSLALVAGLAFFYLFLPFVTDSFAVLGKTAAHLERHDIDPTRYYYTDVSQVREGEEHLRRVLAPR